MSQTPRDGGQAFPRSEVRFDGCGLLAIPGMTLRDYFAAKALPLAWDAEKERPTGPYSEAMEPTYLGAAQRAYFMADAMLKARQA
jgi:hypothetical protein